MTRYDIAKFYGYNSPEEYEEAQRRKREIFVESKKMQKPNAEKEPVEIQPVKRGRWIDEDEFVDIKVCSVCRKEAYWDTDYGQQLFHFCPNCGARMNLKEGKNNE